MNTITNAELEVTKQFYLKRNTYYLQNPNADFSGVIILMRSNSNYPQPIALTLELYHSEEQPFRKSHRLIDLAEAVIKYYTVVIVSNYMESKDVHEDVKAI